MQATSSAPLPALKKLTGGEDGTAKNLLAPTGEYDYKDSGLTGFQRSNGEDTPERSSVDGGIALGVPPYRL